MEMCVETHIVISVDTTRETKRRSITIRRKIHASVVYKMLLRSRASVALDSCDHQDIYKIGKTRTLYFISKQSIYRESEVIMKLFKCFVPVVVLLLIKDSSARPGKFLKSFFFSLYFTAI